MLGINNFYIPVFCTCNHSGGARVYGARGQESYLASPLSTQTLDSSETVGVVRCVKAARASASLRLFLLCQRTAHPHFNQAFKQANQRSRITISKWHTVKP